MYGVLQPLVVTRIEVQKEDGGLATEYELIAGERRLRASRLAGLREVPAIIRAQEHSDKMKLELAIIENLQREDLNPVDRAVAFKKLVDEFKFTHADVGKKVGRSREYVSNSLRILNLPKEMLDALSARKISEGHTRPLLMLTDRPMEQMTLFKEIIFRGLNVRDAELVARKIAQDRARRKDVINDPELSALEGQIARTLGTRVHIEKRQVGGKIEIDYFSLDDLKKLLALLETGAPGEVSQFDSSLGTAGIPGVIDGQAFPTENQIAENNLAEMEMPASFEISDEVAGSDADAPSTSFDPSLDELQTSPELDERIMNAPAANPEAPLEEEEDIYSIKNFSV
jgi:ParB family chromosome partitioning protein